MYYASHAILKELDTLSPNDPNVKAFLNEIDKTIQKKPESYSRKALPKVNPSLNFTESPKPIPTNIQSPAILQTKTETTAVNKPLPKPAKTEPKRQLSTVIDNKSSYQPIQKNYSATPYQASSNINYKQPYIIPTLDKSELEKAEIEVISKWRDTLIIDKILPRGKNSLLKIGNNVFRPGDIILPAYFCFLEGIQ